MRRATPLRTLPAQVAAVSRSTCAELLNDRRSVNVRRYHAHERWNPCSGRPLQLSPRHIRRRRRLPRSFVARPLRWYSALDSAHRRGLNYGSAPRFGSRARDRTRTGGVRKHLVLGGQMRAFSEVTQSCTRRARSRSERPFPTFRTGRTCAVCSATNSLACACRLWGTCIRFRPRPSNE